MPCFTTYNPQHIMSCTSTCHVSVFCPLEESLTPWVSEIHSARDISCGPAGSKAVHPQLMMYKCVAKPWVMRVGALVLGATSFMVVWSEATIGLGRRPDVSPFSLVNQLYLSGRVHANDSLSW